MAGSEAAKEAISISALARELGLHDDSPIDLHMDNRSAIDVSYNPEHHGRMKHVARRHFFIRECVENHQIRVPFVRTDGNQADFFTKVKTGAEFVRMRDVIMNVPSGARGGVEGDTPSGSSSLSERVSVDTVVNTVHTPASERVPHNSIA